MSISRIFILALVFFSFSHVASAQKEIPYVILVSFDGFRHDYVDKLNLLNFKAFIKKGTQAEAIIPCFPSLTFPNHYSIVTGMYPGTHGLVDNGFYDSARNVVYRMSDRDKVVNPYFYGGTPLWQLARQHGIKSASYFWVGSELNDPKLRPDYYFLYDESVPFQSRIDQVIAWLKLPEKERPHFITLYFDSPDHQSHEFGPFGEETRKTLLRMDSLLGNLMKGLQDVKLPVNTILVSDHGLSELTMVPETFIFLDELIDINNKSIRIVHGRTITHFYVDDDPTKLDSLYNVLKKQEKNYTIRKKKDLPEHWHYQNPRVGDLVMVPAPYHSLQRSGRDKFSEETTGRKFGVHGYDPAETKDVWGIFYAHGPNIKAGQKIPAVPNIDVYPLIAKILGLKLPKIDGNPETLNKVYKK
ncbi:MAG TPA: ectonucleotide pyrophosphatase/phosphodiesterase [Cyclobacteriaceae bacterium]|nr:ectonucleotide pyrophosphatase/phosphodiesterase [Cyclobacteriaceae bacterium]